MIAYGDNDIGILRVDGTMDKWIERVNKIKNRNTKISVIKSAAHSFKGYEVKLSKSVEAFVREII